MRLLLDTSAVLHLASGTLSSAAADALRSGGLAVLSAVVPRGAGHQGQGGQARDTTPAA